MLARETHEIPRRADEEARRRARRRRWYGACALVAALAALIAYFGFNGGGATPSQVGSEGPSPGAGMPSEAGAGAVSQAGGLRGSYIRALTVDPLRPTTVFAATLDAGVFRSTDGGASWKPLTMPSTAIRADSLAIPPADPQTIYAGTGGGIFKSTDGGATWQAANSGLFGKETARERNHRLIEGYVYALLVDPRSPETVYAATIERGLLKSTNGGASWRPVGVRTSEDAVVLDPKDPETIYVGGAMGGREYKGGVFKSTDGGSTWRAAGLQGRTVDALTIDPQHSQTLYAGTDTGAFKSRDGGKSWHALGLQGSVWPLALDPIEPTTVYAGTGADADAAVFKSTNGGRSWKALKVGREGRIGAFTLALAPGSSGTLYAATAAGVLKSSDAGRSWERQAPADCC
jgi:hypothetical protein